MTTWDPLRKRGVSRADDHMLDMLAVSVGFSVFGSGVSSGEMHPRGKQPQKEVSPFQRSEWRDGKGLRVRTCPDGQRHGVPGPDEQENGGGSCSEVAEAGQAGGEKKRKKLKCGGTVLTRIWSVRLNDKVVRLVKNADAAE
jgi:hypothetical protein